MGDAAQEEGDVGAGQCECELWEVVLLLPVPVLLLLVLGLPWLDSVVMCVAQIPRRNAASCLQGCEGVV